MAKATTAKAPKKVKKAGKPAALKSKPEGSKKGGGKKKSKANGKGMDLLWKLAEHPLVGELIAVGATAAVAAIAEQSIAREGKGKKKVPSNAAVKAAGTAAAAAIGQRLINEFTDIKKVKKKASA
jgi:hypothetical protein